MKQVIVLARLSWMQTAYMYLDPMNVYRLFMYVYGAI